MMDRMPVVADGIADTAFGGAVDGARGCGAALGVVVLGKVILARFIDDVAAGAVFVNGTAGDKWNGARRRRR